MVTDPPYYDNMGYADLSDFFYIWMRRALRDVYPGTFGTVLTPKLEELTAVRHRFGGNRDQAERFFTDGFRDAFSRLAEVQSPEYPLCFFYAYKQKESKKIKELMRLLEILQNLNPRRFQAPPSPKVKKPLPKKK